MLLLGFIYRNYKIWNNFPQTSFWLHTYFWYRWHRLCSDCHTASGPEPWCYNLGEQTVGRRQIAGSYSSTAMVNNKMLLTEVTVNHINILPLNSNNLYLKLSFPLTGTQNYSNHSNTTRHKENCDRGEKIQTHEHIAKAPSRTLERACVNGGLGSLTLLSLIEN